MSHRKLKLVSTMSVFSLWKLLRRFHMEFDIIERLNAHYREEFRKLPYSARAVVLPHCLRSDSCPARLSSREGVLCQQCGKCRCGEIKKIAEDLGYGFFIAPSFSFTKRIISGHGFRGVLGIGCDHEMDGVVKEELIDRYGIKIERANCIPQGIKLPARNCSGNTIDWDLLERAILES